MNVKIIIATHKKYQFPEGNMYLPIQVGAAGKPDIGCARDDTGDNISQKNSGYCELTGVYWAWKNLEADYMGVVHYRRHLTMKNPLLVRQENKWNIVLDDSDINKLVSKYDVIVPKKRRYYIESLYTHYANTHHGEHLDIAKKIIEDRCPEYEPFLKDAYNATSGYMFNMFVMKRELFELYCSWLFPILEELEEQVNVAELSGFQARLFGRVSEILFNCWIAYLVVQQPEVKIKEVSHLHMEQIDWSKKATAFMKAKCLKTKYEGGF